MNASPHKRSSSAIAPPVGHLLGARFISLARSRLPVPNKAPKPRTHRRTFLGVAPVPFAPLVDTHAFQPPPPYSARPDIPTTTSASTSNEFPPVPHNTPEEQSATAAQRRHSLAPSAPPTTHARPTFGPGCGVGLGLGLGLGLEGVERGDGERFDGLGRLSGGFRAAGVGNASSGEVLRDEVQRMLTEHSRRRRTRASEQPSTRHDVFYASVEVREQAVAASDGVSAGMVKIRIRRKSAASPTPGPRRWEGVCRGTISSELKRAASLERRASMGGRKTWRV